MKTPDVQAFKKLIATATLPALGPQRRPEARSAAELHLALDAFFRTAPGALEHEQPLRSAAMLWHDHLDESHQISQNLPDTTGSFLHGIMHRREPDYGNAKYWFSRVGEHASSPVLARRVSELLAKQAVPDPGLTRLGASGRWDAFQFVDLCEAAANAQQPRYQLLQQIQAVEFETLLEHL
ncbi:MAG: hypothetical protein U1G07_20660 [Verrucomicrobiota bacterium]